MKRFLIMSLVMFLWLSPENAQTVSTMYGQVQGVMNGSVYQFLGIPFAKPPVDSLRWKAPLNPDTWSDILLATGFAPVCPQKKFEQGDTTYTIEGSEDCLYLNIWTPLIGEGNKPVMVFIHGGGNQQGGASEVNGGTQMFFGKNLSERGDVVVVTVQYRLGPLGFLVHPGLDAENTNNVSGNYAVLDQIMALKWIQQNIAGFGGDPDNVMIFGESAGGVNVGNLLTTSLASGLFQRACIQSAAPVINNYQDGEDKGIAYVNKFTTTGIDSEKIAYMRSLSSDSLLYSETSPLSGGMVQMNWQPVVDHLIFMDTPVEVFQRGEYNKVPLIIGSNSEEMSLSVPETVFPAMVNALIGISVPEAYQEGAHELYPSGSNTTEARESYVAILTDGQFTANARRTAQCISLNQSEPVWRYFFTHKHTLAQLEKYGSYHGMELFYVFNNWENATLGTGVLFKPADDSVQQAMLNYWTNFARTGNPNGGNWTGWPQYQAATDCYMEIKATPDGSHCGLRTEKSDFWDDVAGFGGCTGSGVTDKNMPNLTISVFPNPTEGILNLMIPYEYNEFEITISNIFGQQVIHTRNDRTIQLTEFPDGIYCMEVKMEGRHYISKIIKLSQ